MSYRHTQYNMHVNEILNDILVLQSKVKNENSLLGYLDFCVEFRVSIL